MKRFAAGAVAVATALSLSTGVASAANTDEESALVGLAAGIYGAVNGVSEPASGSAETSSDAMDSSSKSEKAASSKAYIDFYQSSWDNDANNKYKLGTTADILWGFGIAAAVLAAGAAAVNAGVIPGVSLPF
ncbi:hypothetical protein HMPREF3227_02550 [Corynebacterium sp. CMW7794]|uniref:hypothetical protein n=1 Tax=Corynebacterium TaxID=1716 RepID=UPI00079907A4|nr:MULTISPECIES: hypothetical protein [Corynebacterium]KXI15255.1 hypothetical protein HMPREF3227_02550 [Corynebacterium sp. CMW7794]